MKIDGPPVILSASSATVADTQRPLSLREMFPDSADRKPFKTADHKIVFLKKPLGGEAAQVDRREGRGSGLKQRLGCGAESRSYTGQAINICIDREQFEGAYERLAPKLLDTQSPITRFRVVNALALDSYDSLDGDTWITLCIRQDNNFDEVLSYLAELGATLNEAEIKVGKKPEIENDFITGFGGYFTYYRGDLTGILRGFEFHCEARSMTHLDVALGDDPHAPSSDTHIDVEAPTGWRYFHGN